MATRRHRDSRIRDQSSTLAIVAHLQFTRSAADSPLVRTLLRLTLVVAAFLGGIAFEKKRERTAMRPLTVREWLNLPRPNGDWQATQL